MSEETQSLDDVLNGVKPEEAPEVEEPTPEPEATAEPEEAEEDATAAPEDTEDEGQEPTAEAKPENDWAKTAYMDGKRKRQELERQLAELSQPKPEEAKAPDIFEDQEGKMNRSCLETRGEVLVVSQFTLLGNCRKGRRPSFVEAAPPDKAERLYEYFVSQVRSKGLTVATGRFQAYMAVSLVNSGPVTLIVESR